MKSMMLQTTTRDDLNISFINEEEFEELWHEIFQNNQYIFSCKTDAPFIIDCGAHIGMSILYFKRRYPYAQIIAFEPNPQTFQILEQNIRQNHLQDVQLVNAGVGNNDGKIPFYVRQDSTKSWGDTSLKGAIVGSEQQWRSISVHAVRLSSYITRPIDFLKMDIEGMEETVLREIEEKLPLITEIRIEFHYNSTNQANNLDRTLSSLSRNNFKYAFERKRRVISINDIRRDMKHIDPYQFVIYTHRSRRRVLWQSWFVPKLIRIQNRVMRRV
ncbi:MAG: FkbM family methyltransferase [Ktedonobacteraceae bacterium]